MKARKSKKEFASKFICTERGGYWAKADNRHDERTKRCVPGDEITDAVVDKMYYSVTEEGKKVFYVRRGFEEVFEKEVVEEAPKAAPAAPPVGEKKEQPLPKPNADRAKGKKAAEETGEWD